MTDEEAAVVELLFPSRVWGRVEMKTVDDQESQYKHTFYFKDVPVDVYLKEEEKKEYFESDVEILNLKKEIDWLLGRISELDVDRRRLDWLNNQSDCALIYDGISSWAISFNGVYREEDDHLMATFFVGPDDFCGSVRSAIDSVRLDGSILKGDDDDR